MLRIYTGFMLSIINFLPPIADIGGVIFWRFDDIFTKIDCSRIFSPLLLLVRYKQKISYQQII